MPAVTPTLPATMACTTNKGWCSCSAATAARKPMPSRLTPSRYGNWPNNLISSRGSRLSPVAARWAERACSTEALP